MTPASFEPIIIKNLFSELFGFALCDPDGLDIFAGGSAIGVDLLTRFTDSEDGDFISKNGIAIPIVGLEEGYYTLVVRNDTDKSLLKSSPRKVSKGWVLHAPTGRVCLCGLGYLKDWNPNNKKVYCFNIPSGWYEVTIACGVNTDQIDEAPIIEFVLHAVESKPVFTANLNEKFNFSVLP